MSGVPSTADVPGGIGRILGKAKINSSAAFISILESRNISISMDGRGRAFDNIFVERLWRSVKYEEVYLHQYTTVSDAQRHLERYFRLYNTERLHESLGYQTPYEIYFKEQPGCFEPKVALVY